MDPLELLERVDGVEQYIMFTTPDYTYAAFKFTKRFVTTAAMYHYIDEVMPQHTCVRPLQHMMSILQYAEGSSTIYSNMDKSTIKKKLPFKPHCIIDEGGDDKKESQTAADPIPTTQPFE